MTTPADLRITRLQIKDFRGIAVLDEVIPPAGVVISGRSKSGKTSILRAISTALAGRDIGGDAVRHNATKGEILVDMGNVQVARYLSTKTKATLEVSTDGGKSLRKAPQTFLNEILGTAAIDPLELMTAKPADRRAIVLSALPVEVSETKLRSWAPALPEGFSTDGHGLDVVARAHKHFYDLRTEANAKAKTLATEAKRLKDLVLPILVAVPVDQAKSAAAAATAALAEVESKRKAFLAAQDRTAESRAQIAKLRAEADEHAQISDRTAPLASDVENAVAEVNEAETALAAAKRALDLAQTRVLGAGARVKQLSDLARSAKEYEDKATNARATATQLEAAIAQVAPDATEAEIIAAGLAATEAAKALAEAEEAERRTAARVLAEAAAKSLEHANVIADDLDATVKRLDGAPAELLAESNGIPGLSLLGDDIALDGVVLTKACGLEQIRVCVGIAKRLSKVKLLIVDGLERIDPDTREDFLREATRDGWQLIGSLVERGERRFLGVEAGDNVSPAAAE